LEREYIDDLISHRIEGLMLAPASDRSRLSILTLLRGSFPLVLIDRALPDVECDVVVSDNIGGSGGWSST
jgi:LacI family transcriptional regulator